MVILPARVNVLRKYLDILRASVWVSPCSSQGCDAHANLARRMSVARDELDDSLSALWNWLIVLIDDFQKHGERCVAVQRGHSELASSSNADLILRN